MGLCKCIKQKVTNQFCFEHRVNVCEHCMVQDHPKCVVQSYLQWLNDSDYNPVCQLCQEDLVSAECIRLVCYDVFHRLCLNDWASKLPSNTAPAGYRCPVCSSAIFPAPNLVSPIADELRAVLQSCEWARTGLGMPIVKGTSVPDQTQEINPAASEMKLIGTHYNLVPSDRGIPDGHDVTATSPLPSSEVFRAGLASTSQHRNASRKEPLPPDDSPPSSSSVMIGGGSDDDSGEEKYRRRSALEWLNRWLRTFQRPSSRHHQGLLGGSRRVGCLATLLTICAIIFLVSYLGRSISNNDPMLDPFNNPNIRVEEESI